MINRLIKYFLYFLKIVEIKFLKMNIISIKKKILKNIINIKILNCNN